MLQHLVGDPPHFHSARDAGKEQCTDRCSFGGSFLSLSLDSACGGFGAEKQNGLENRPDTFVGEKRIKNCKEHQKKPLVVFQC